MAGLRMTMIGVSSTRTGPNSSVTLLAHRAMPSLRVTNLRVAPSKLAARDENAKIQLTLFTFRDITAFRNQIDSMPLVDSTEVFGLHANADMSFSIKESNDLLGKVLDIQPKDSAAATGRSREDTVKEILEDLVAKLPSDFQANAVKPNLQKQGATKPLTIFLSQEINRLQTVISTVRSSLKDLRLAIEGVIVCSAPIQQVMDALFDAKTPPSWLRISWETPALGPWFLELTQRYAPTDGREIRG